MTTRSLVRSVLTRMMSPDQLALTGRRLRTVEAIFHSNDCVKLSAIFGSDKWGDHWYAQHYNRHFLPLRMKRLTIVEIGVGGYGDPNDGGASLRLWKRFFPRGKIVGIDIYDKHAIEEHRIKTYQGRQEDPVFLQGVVAEIGRPDIVIDDGSHRNDHVIATFQVLFPLLKDNGIYVVEDMQTSYLPSFGGRPGRTMGEQTTMGFFRSLTDGLNYSEYLVSGDTPSYLDQHIVSMHFYHNLVFIYKGLNDEASSNRPGDVKSCRSTRASREAR
jgi:hypothetical protein